MNSIELAQAIKGLGFAVVPSNEEGLYALYEVQSPAYRVMGNAVDFDLTPEEVIAAVEAQRAK